MDELIIFFALQYSFVRGNCYFLLLIKFQRFLLSSDNRLFLLYFLLWLLLVLIRMSVFVPFALLFDVLFLVVVGRGVGLVGELWGLVSLDD